MFHSRMDPEMAENFDSLTLLLQLLTPGCSADQQFALLARINPEQWDALILEADRQDVAPLLYALLEYLNKSCGFDIPQKEKLHQAYLTTAARNMLALHEAEIVFSALRHAGIAAAGLKGIYLLEHAYPNIGARSMNDIDLLIKKQDLHKCLEVMRESGYKTTAYFSLADKNIDTKHVPPMQNESGIAVELHWTLLEEQEPFTIDIEALWQRTIPAKITNVEMLALSVEDLILHLCLHLTYQHYLNLGLRSLMDIAIVIHKFQTQIDWQKLVEIAQSWGAQRVAALTLKLVETQLNVSIPAEVITTLVPEGIDPNLLDNARALILDRVRFEDHFTPDLVDFSGQATLFSKMKIGLRRVFIPRLALARTFNIPPNSPKIIGRYWIRLKYLIRNYGKTILRLQRGEKGIEPALQKAEISNSLHEWMTSHNGDIGQT